MPAPSPASPGRPRRTLVLALLAALGCGDRPSVDEVTTSLTGGTVVSNDNPPPYNSVVKFDFNAAVKIGNRRFLTCGHCLDSLGVGEEVSLTNVVRPPINGPTARLTRIDRHPLYDLLANTQARFSSAYDVGVFEIDRDTPTIPPLAVHAPFVDDFTPGIAVGYGLDDGQPSHNRLKQKAPVSPTGSSDPDVQIHYLTLESTQVSSDGDDGGVLLVRRDLESGPWEIGGIISTFTQNQPPAKARTRFARVGSVRRWILAPAKDVFADGESGNFLNGKSAKCIGIAGASHDNGAAAMQFFCDSRNQPNDNQSWMLRALGNGRFNLVNRNSGLCLGVDGGSVADFAALAQFTCAPDPSNNQAWRFVRTSGDYYQVVNGKSGKCMGVDGASTNNAVRLLQATCTPLGAMNNMSWLFTR